jgi:tetraacyldisaccharide 4'-kinase
MKQTVLERAESYLVRIITDRDGKQDPRRRMRLLIATLRQLSRVYRALVQLRLLLYAHGILRHHTLGCQVISVGNLTVGGTGKTPVVEVFARELQKEGRKVAVLSRGYKKEQPPFARRLLDKLLFRQILRPPLVVSDGTRLLLDSARSGDEPYMLASHLPHVAVLVDRDRVKSGRYAINKFGCDTLILDDGFQYLALKHRVEIVLVDCTNPFGNGFILPRGILREPVGNVRRANFIFITKSDGSGNEELKRQLREHNRHAEIVECRHCARYVQNAYTQERRPLEFLKGLRIVTLAGIAAPDGFEAELERQGAVILDRKRFTDHHRYAQQEMIDLVNSATRLAADAIVTTEKDAVRLPRLYRCDVPVHFLRVDIEILSGEEDFRACISRICFREALEEEQP